MPDEKNDFEKQKGFTTLNLGATSGAVILIRAAK
jgi:hypothetical protein